MAGALQLSGGTNTSNIETYFIMNTGAFLLKFLQKIHSIYTEDHFTGPHRQTDVAIP